MGIFRTKSVEGIFRTKSVEQSIRDTQDAEFRLRKELGAFDLIVFGIGVIIGTGIFVMTGVAAATRAGPAISLSFVVAGIACALAALCYAELASAVPVAGSAYTYSYAALGEIIAWIIGWDLILEFSVAAAAVAIGWSQYVNAILQGIGLPLPAAIAGGHNGRFDLFAGAVVLLLTLVVVRGIGLSSRVIKVMTILKVGVVVFFIAFGVAFVKPANWVPFIPPAVPMADAVGSSSVLDTPLVQLLTGGGGLPLAFGIQGVLAAAAIVFFAFLGFDVVATMAEETRNPQRNVPIGIIGSLAVATVLYIAVSLVMTGIVPYTQLNTAAPMATAFAAIGQPWAAALVSAGAVAGLTTVTMVLLVGQSRVFFAMSRDHLLPAGLGKVHPRWGTPYRITLGTGLVIALVAALTPIGDVAELVNIGTLLAFVLVSVGVVVLRRKRPELRRAFRTPLVPLVPVLSTLACLYLMVNLPVVTWIRFVVWMVVGIAVYALYGARHSKLGQQAERPADGAPELAVLVKGSQLALEGDTANEPVTTA